MEKEPIVRMEGIYKSFGAVRAVENVDCKLNHNEIVGLVGDNGAGKTTLVKILAGVFPPDRGKILFEGKKVNFNSPIDSRNLGIEVIHQNLGLADDLNVERNIFMGREPTKPVLGGLIRLLDEEKMAKSSWEVLRNIKIDISSTKEKVKNLSGGQRQSIAVGRAFYFRAKIIIMDEPVAALGASETNKVLALARRLKKEGLSIIFIAHNLYHVFSVADRIVVLRRGQKIGDKRIKETTMDEITKLMVGEEG